MSEYAFDGHKLRLVRTRRVMTQRELASVAGVSYVTVCRLETGARKRAQAATVRALAGALGVEPVALLSRTARKPKPADPAPRDANGG